MTHGGGWLTVTGVPVPQANDLLGASYQLYRHTGTNKTILRTVGYALPAALHAHVETVVPTTYFSPPRTRQQTPRKLSREEAAEKVKATSGGPVTVLSTRDKDIEVFPEVLRWLYKTENYVPVATDRNMLGVVGFQDDLPSQEALTTFMSVCRPDAVDPTFTVVPINGGVYGPSDLTSDEANMNIQYAEAMVYPTPLIFYSVGGTQMIRQPSGEPAPGDEDLEWLNYMLSQDNIPRTISMSYGSIEKNLPPAYMTSLCKLYALLGARGVSVLVSSGDDGVGKGDCKSKDDPPKVQFVPEFPASCTCGILSLLCKQYTRRPRIRRSVGH
jgi:tripeptidyl-peptidase-1